MLSWDVDILARRLPTKEPRDLGAAALKKAREVMIQAQIRPILISRTLLAHVANQTR